MNPQRRAAFEQLRNLARSQSRRGFHQHVNVVLDSTYLQRAHLVLSRDAADKFPDALFYVGLDVADTVFSAENDVVVQRRVSVCHNRPLVSWPLKAGRGSIVAPRLDIYFVSRSRP